MATPIFILGQSGSGKSFSLKNLNPKETFLIQSVKKRLPFRSPDWTPYIQGKKGGTIYSAPTHEKNTYPLIEKMLKSVSRSRKVIIIDDFQYFMSAEFMRRSAEKSYDKFTDIGKNAWSIIMTIIYDLPDDVRVYMLCHTDISENGHEQAKTIGKLLNDKITLEGLFTIVLKTVVESGMFTFSTQNNGNDTVKTPYEMFDSSFIDNDLLQVDNAFCDFYGIERQPLKETEE